MNKSQMLDEIATFFGEAGLDVQIGSKTIKGKKPKTIKSVTAKDGTVLREGMCVRRRLANDPKAIWWAPEIIVKIIPGNPPKTDVVDVDDPDRLIHHWLPHYIWGHDYGKGTGHQDWYNEFQVLTQADVDDWWHDTRTLKPGWHDDVHNGLRVHIDANGVPDIVARASMGAQIEHIRQKAEIVTGYDLTIERRYLDDDKLQRRVKTAVRRNPPQIQ
jgi:hypothetical protein